MMHPTYQTVCISHTMLCIATQLSFTLMSAVRHLYLHFYKHNHSLDCMFCRIHVFPLAISLVVDTACSTNLQADHGWTRQRCWFWAVEVGLPIQCQGLNLHHWLDYSLNINEAYAENCAVIYCLQNIPCHIILLTQRPCALSAGPLPCC